VADSGYGSEENYRFMEENGVEAYVKCNWFHKERRPRHTADPFNVNSLYCNKEKDYYVWDDTWNASACTTTIPQAATSLRPPFTKHKARERLTSEEGLMHRERKCVEPEAVFRQMKNKFSHLQSLVLAFSKATSEDAICHKRR